MASSSSASTNATIDSPDSNAPVNAHITKEDGAGVLEVSLDLTRALQQQQKEQEFQGQEGAKMPSTSEPDSARASSQSRLSTPRAKAAAAVRKFSRLPSSLGKGVMSVIRDGADELIDLVDGSSRDDPPSTFRRSQAEEEALKEKLFKTFAKELLNRKSAPELSA